MTCDGKSLGMKSCLSWKPFCPVNSAPAPIVEGMAILLSAKSVDFVGPNSDSFARSESPAGHRVSPIPRGRMPLTLQCTLYPSCRERDCAQPHACSVKDGVGQ
jgi:hypothetical protein